MKIKSWYSAFLLAGLLLTLLLNCKKEVTPEDENMVLGSSLPPSNGVVEDMDGNKYSTVVIGTQVWLASNLKTTKYSDGTAIPLVTDGTVWLNNVTPGYCWYNNDATTYKSTYGALYNWYTVNTGKLCPTGWHVPTNTEWSKLTNYLGGYSSSIGYWTDLTDFIPVPGGMRSYKGAFFYIGIEVIWWSSTEDRDIPGGYAWSRTMFYDKYSIGKTLLSASPMLSGLSVRCLQD
jgi:uncharacterized protein (TIGR02145 family)